MGMNMKTTYKAAHRHTARQPEAESETEGMHSRATVIDINEYTSVPEQVAKRPKSTWLQALKTALNASTD